jgi:hypothetical protein
MYGFVRGLEVGGNYLRASFRQCHCYRLTDTLAGACDYRYSPIVCSY